MLPQPAEKDNTTTEGSSIHDNTTSSSIPPLSTSTRTRTTSSPVTHVGFGQSQSQQQAQQQTSRRRNVSTGSSSESAVARRISSSSGGLTRHPQHYHPRGRTSSSTSASAAAGESSSSSLSSPPSLIEWLSKNKKEKTRKKQQQRQREDHHKKTDEGSASSTTNASSSTFDIKHDPGGSSIASSNTNALDEHQQVVTNITGAETPDTALSVGLVRRSLVEEEGGGNDGSSTIFVTPKKIETDNKTDVRFRSGGDGKQSNSTTGASSILPHYHDSSNSTPQPQHVRRKNDKLSQEKKDKRKHSFQQKYKRPSSPPMIGNTLSGSNGTTTSSSWKQCILNHILSCLLEKPFSRLLTQCIIVFVVIEVMVWQWTTRTLFMDHEHPLHHGTKITTVHDESSKNQIDDHNHNHHSVVHVLMSSFQKKKEYHHHRNRIKEAESTHILLSLFDSRSEKWENESKKEEHETTTSTRKMIMINVDESSTVEETNNQRRERRTSTTTPEEVHSAIYNERRTFVEHHINNQQNMPPFHIRTSPNYGGIEFSSIAPPHDRDESKHHHKSMLSDMPGTITNERGRIIYHPYREGASYDDNHHKRSIEEDDTILRSEFAFDDDMIRGKHVGERHSHHHHHHKKEDESPPPHCVRPSWYRDMYPSCNNFHELDFIADEGMLLGKGHYKVAYEFNLVPFTSEKVVMKAMNFKKHEFDIAIIENSRMESLIMERLSSSPRVVDIYGMCGTSTLLEHMPHEIKEPMLWQGEGYASEEDIENCEQHIQQVYQKESGSTEPDPSIMCPTSNEEWSPTHKLQMALHMAEALAYVHGYVGGVMVHDDIKIGQYLMNSKGEIKLNDFNRGEIMFYDTQHERYCKYRNGYVNGIHRAPEENSNHWLNEQIDVYSLGNIYYSLLTGLWNFYTYEDDEVVQQKVIDGDLPYLDPRYETRSYAEKALKEVIEYTLIYDASKRPSIFQVVKFLRERVERNQIKERKAKRRTIGR